VVFVVLGFVEVLLVVLAVVLVVEGFFPGLVGLTGLVGLVVLVAVVFVEDEVLAVVFPVVDVFAGLVEFVVFVVP
jgi:hypothetical protein